MKNKKGLFMIPAMIVLVLIIVALILMIWFGLRISEGITSLVGFFQSYGLWIIIAIAVLVFRMQIQAVLNWILGRFGIKV